MKQLSFAFAGGPRAVIQIMPQPVKNGWGAVFRDDWVWSRGDHTRLATDDPSRSDGMLKSSPYQIGKSYEDHIIQKVSVVDTRAYGWCWVLELREPDYDNEPLDWFWDDLPRTDRPTRCEHCGIEARSGEYLEPLHNVPPIEGDFDDPIKEPKRAWVLCGECKEEHEGYWRRMLRSASGDV